jgi:SAM-dependent methyltransferase
LISTDARLLEVMAQAVNYHQWTYRVLQPYVGNRVLEVGGGIGSLSAFLQDRERLISIDLDPRCTQELRDQLGERPNVRVLTADILDPTLPPMLAEERLDTVLCVNVLEHIDDDLTALRHMHQALQPGGRVGLLVPAHPALYGTLDELVGHHRRYTRRALMAKAEQAGFTVLMCRSFNSVGVFGWFLAGRVRRQQGIGSGQVRFYDHLVVPVLRRLEGAIPPPFGQSLVLVGHRG